MLVSICSECKSLGFGETYCSENVVNIWAKSSEIGLRWNANIKWPKFVFWLLPSHI